MRIVRLTDKELLQLVLAQKHADIPEGQLARAYELALKDSGLESYVPKKGWTPADYQSAQILKRREHLYDPTLSLQWIQEGIEASLVAGRIVKAWFYPSCITGLTNVVLRGYENPKTQRLVESPLHFPAEEKLGDSLDDLITWMRAECVQVKYVKSGKY
jgi:hypothetical protein